VNSKNSIRVKASAQSSKLEFSQIPSATLSTAPRGSPVEQRPQLSRAREGRVRFDPGGDHGLELAPFGPDRLGDRGEGLSDDRRRAMLALLLDPIFLVFQGRPGLNQPVEFLPRGIVRLGVGVGKRLGEPGDRISVDRIVLGQPSGRFGEMTNPFRGYGDSLLNSHSPGAIERPETGDRLEAKPERGLSKLDCTPSLRHANSVTRRSGVVGCNRQYF